jgi:hypothetical protein
MDVIVKPENFHNWRPAKRTSLTKFSIRWEIVIHVKTAEKNKGYSTVSLRSESGPSPLGLLPENAEVFTNRGSVDV